MVERVPTSDDRSLEIVVTGASDPRWDDEDLDQLKQILDLVRELKEQGLGNKVIAGRLAISEHTVKSHVTSVFAKLGVSTRAEAVAAGVRQGLLML